MTRTTLAAAAAAVAVALALAGPAAPAPSRAASHPDQGTLPPPAPTATNIGVPPMPTEPPVTGQVCQFILNKVPPQVIAAALANPDAVYGFNRPRNPNKPQHHLLNPPRVFLSVRNPNVHFHPLFNSLHWVAGCP